VRIGHRPRPACRHNHPEPDSAGRRVRPWPCPEGRAACRARRCDSGINHGARDARIGDERDKAARPCRRAAAALAWRRSKVRLRRRSCTFGVMALGADHALPAWSFRLIDELETSDRRAGDLAGGLTVEQLNWKPGAHLWSVGQCLQHLHVANEVYLPPIADALDGQPRSKVEDITPGWLGRWFIRAYIEPSAQGKRRRAPRKIAPARKRVRCQPHSLPESLCPAPAFHSGHGSGGRVEASTPPPAAGRTDQARPGVPDPDAVAGRPEQAVDVLRL